MHLAVFVVTAPMAPGPMCTKRPWLRPMPSAPAKQQAYTQPMPRGSPVAGSMLSRSSKSRRNRALGRFRRPVQCAPSDHGFVPCLVRRRKAGIYAALATPRTLTVSRCRVQCHSGRQKLGEIVHLAVFVVTAPMAPGPMCTKRPWLRTMPCAPAKQQAYTQPLPCRARLQ